MRLWQRLSIVASRVTVEGLEEIQEALAKMGAGKNAIVDKALKKGVEIVKDEMSRRAPRGEGMGGYKGTGHLKDNIAVSNIEDESGVRAIYAGVKKGDNSNWFYAKFLEWGTVKMKAQPFMQPSYNSKKNKAFKLICDSIKGDLGL